MASYRAGTVTVTQGSKIVTGVDTAFNTVGIYAGDTFSLVDGNNIPTGNLYEVASVESDTKLTLLQAYQGTSGSAKNYVIMNMAGNQTTPRFSAKVSNLLGEIQPIADGLSETSLPGGIPQGDSNGKVSRDWLTINAANGILGLDSSGKAAAAQLPDAALAPRENLLHNWDFRNPVNQRGASEYSTSRKYTIDRWFMISGGGKIIKNSASITLNGTQNGIYLVQPLESSPALLGQKIVISAKVKTGTGTIGVYASEDIYTGYSSPIASKNASGAGITSLIATLPGSITGTLCVYLFASTGTTMEVEAVKMERGSESTLAESMPDYISELSKCLRFVQKVPSLSRFRLLNYAATSLDFAIPGLAVMRTTPSIESGDLEIRNLQVTSANVPIQSTSFYASRGNLFLRATVASGHGLTDGLLYVSSDLILSADI